MKKIYNFLILLCVVTLFSSCEKWLSETTDSQIQDKDQFSSELGFQQVLLGCYIGMADKDLFGKNLSWYLPDLMAQNYDKYEFYGNGNGKNFQEYNYNLSTSRSVIEDMWRKSYNVIINANSALKFIDEKKDVFIPVNHSIIKGELLAIRAFVHFELLRMYGVENLADFSKKTTKLTVPYAKISSKNAPPQYNYNETINLIIADLQEAVELLEVDPITQEKDSEYYNLANENGFLNGREKRINYFAAKAILARVYMWEGSVKSMDNALVIVEDIIKRNDEKKFFNWTNNYDNSYVLADEHIFAINVFNLVDVLEDHFTTNGIGDTQYSALHIFENRADKMYEVSGGNIVGASDIRYSKLLSKTLIYQDNLRAKVSMKYEQISSQNEINIVPLIRLPEIYYIAAECHVKGTTKNLAKAVEYLEIVRGNRGVLVDLSCPDIDSFMLELEKEYRKEFFAEALTYYLYKRLGKAEIVDSNNKVIKMETEQYMLPFPSFEIQSGRVQ